MTKDNIHSKNIKEIKKNHKIYLISVSIVSIIAILVLPSSIKMFVPIIFTFLTFVFYGILNIVSINNTSNYLINNHRKDLERLNIGTSKIGFGRIQQQLIYKNKELSEISPIIKNKLELTGYFGKLAVISFLLIIFISIFGMIITKFI